MSTACKYVWVDPPSGWKYGFPKLYDQSGGLEMSDWILKHGYPQAEMDSCGDHWYVGMWEPSQDEIGLYGVMDNTFKA